MNNVIREARQKAGKTIRAVSADLGVPDRTYACWEYGQGLPSAVRLVSLARYFGITEAEIVEGVSEESRTA